MRKIISLVLCAMLTLSSVCLAACSSISGGYEGEVNVYNWGEYVSPGDEGRLDVIKEFEQRYNIKVNLTNYETNEELYNILVNSNSSYDVIFPSDYMVERLRSEGMLEEIDFSNIPNYKNIDDRFKTGSYDPEGKYTVPYSWGFIALVYNTTMIGDNEIVGFSDLWNPEYAGGILMFNHSRDSMAIAMGQCDPPIDPGASSFSVEDIDRATDKLVEQKLVLKKYVMDQVFTEMETSQSIIAPYYAGDIAVMMDNNEDLDYCLPEEGSNLFIDSMCIPTCCRNKENAELFINFMCEAEIAAANADYLYYGTPNKAAFELMDEDYQENELVNPSEEYMEKCYTFSNIDNDIYTYMQEKFVKACSSTAEINELETKTGNPVATAVVCVIIAVIVILTIVIVILDIRKAVKNRGRINKI